jgi:hypothetical protein
MAVQAARTDGLYFASDAASNATRLGGTMGDTEDDPTTCENQGLVDNGVIGTQLYGTSVQSGSESLALPFADALADVPSSADVPSFADEDDAFASTSKSLRFKLVTASMMAWRARNSSAPLSLDMKRPSLQCDVERDSLLVC